MDQNKLKKLKKLGYEISPCCGLCIHGKFNQNTDFGVCGKHEYKHLKHKRTCELSVFKYGHCDEFEINVMCEYILRQWKQFIRKNKKKKKEEDDIDFVEYMKQTE